ncbi:hypothetical protein N0V90_006024 [Kalmusia sp. IMI 367209]|nr:hypothetical protein N0V90_006024 [Kalmusia sp. IMI 367209]
MPESLLRRDLTLEAEGLAFSRQASFIKWKMKTIKAEIRTMERQMSELRLVIFDKEQSLSQTWNK